MATLYEIRDRFGQLVDVCLTREVATETIRDFEIADEMDGTYMRGWYRIVEVHKDMPGEMPTES